MALKAWLKLKSAPGTLNASCECVMAAVVQAKGKRSHWFWWGLEAGGMTARNSHSHHSMAVHAGISPLKSTSQDLF